MSMTENLAAEPISAIKWNSNIDKQKAEPFGRSSRFEKAGPRQQEKERKNRAV